MLKKQHRLNKNKQFNRLWQSGRSAYGAILGVKVLPNNLPQSRFAFIVSKKVSKRAVVRNLLKRRLREIVRLEYQQIPGWDLAISVLPQAAGRDYQALQNELAFLFKKLKII